MRKILGLALIVLLPVFARAEKCDLTMDGVRKYEYRFMNTDTKAQQAGEKMSASLSCLMEIQEKADPDTRFVANAFLRGILTGPHAQQFERISLLGDTTAQEFARGDWAFYKLFCEQGDVEYCATMIPDEEKIKSQSPLLAATSMLHLRTAYQKMTGEQKKQIGQRIKNLYESIPKQAKVQRKFIEEIYAELFGKDIPLSWNA